MIEIKNNRLHETIYGIETISPPIPSKKQILNWDLPKKQQKFIRTTVPKNFETLPPKEQEEFIAREWDRRINGVFIYINGQLCWLPGGFYFELTWWVIDIGRPKDYRDRDRRKWLFWDHCVKDPDSFGCLYLKHRRDGATFWSGCINYEMTSRTKNALSGIQSKTGPDASKVFQKAVVLPFRKLPYFFRPIFDGTDAPKKELRFFEPVGRMTKKHRTLKGSVALESYITWKPTVAEAFDGEKLLFLHLDEQGKNVECKFTELWKIARECLSLGGGSRIIGKSLVTSTVAEAVKKGGNEFKKVWEQSNPLERNANGRTVSGLYRLFIKASDGLEGFIGEFGESIIHGPTPEQLAYLRKSNPGFRYQEGVGAEQHILNEREGLRLTGDFDGLAEHRRLYPLTESDAFTPPANTCLFNRYNLDQRYDELGQMDNPLTRGDLAWTDGVDSDVKFVPNPANGKFLFSWVPSKEEANRVRRLGSIFMPDNKAKFVIGVDPVDHDQTTDDGRKSMFAAGAFRKYDILDPDKSHKFIATYVNRPGKAEIAFEDMVMLSRFLGCEILYENNKPGMKRHFETRGYGSFIMARPQHTHTKNTRGQKEPGVPASDLIHGQLVEEWEAYVHDYSHLIDFPALILDLMDFDIHDTRKFDLAMSCGYALIGSKKFQPKRLAESTGGGYVKTYSRDGRRVV